MINHDCEQGTHDWLMARLGIPTASAFEKIITPKTLKLSSQATTYRNQLLAEWLLGHPIDWGGQSGFMDRGRRMEEEARAYYELQRDVEAVRVGFVTRDDGLVGGSPDSLIGDDGILEIKCPAIHTHIGYLLGDGADYRMQVQGYLYLTERAWADVMSYHPDLPSSIVRVERDEELIRALDRTVSQFVQWLLEGREKLAPHRAEMVAHV